MRQPIVAHREAIRIFGENGGLLVAAATNASEDLDSNWQFPAAYANARAFPEINNVITVGSINSSGKRSSFSNWGTNSVSIFAPGENILSTLPNSDYGYMSGTSMASPHVAGVAALILSKYPNLTPQEVRAAILNGSNQIDITHPSGFLNLGSTTITVKQLNAYKALEVAPTVWPQPRFTSWNTTTDNYSHGTVTASGPILTGEDGWRAFDGVISGKIGNTYHQWTANAKQGYIELQLNYYIKVYQIDFYQRVSSTSNRDSYL